MSDVEPQDEEHVEEEHAKAVPEARDPHSLGMPLDERHGANYYPPHIEERRLAADADRDRTAE